MHERFAAAHRIEDAITRSDLDMVRSQARVLAALTEPDALPRWRPYFQELAVAARHVAAARDVVAAANSAATLGRQCGHCHAALAVAIKFPEELRPSDDVRLAPQMLGHQWAAARMWEGLIGPADDRWLAGAQALTHVPLTIVAEEPTTQHTGADQIGDDVARVRLYAKRALAASDPDARAAIFGELLATCAHCHAVIRDR